MIKQSRALSANHLAALALFFLALIWGYNWVVMKIGLEYSQPFTFSAIRAFFGAVVLLAMLPIMRRPLRPRALGLTALLGVLQTTGFVGLLTWALQNGGAGKTSILTYTMPFWLLLMAWVVLGERLKSFQWAAVAFAFCGLILVLSPWHMSGGLSELLAVGGAVSWAASAVVAKILRRRHEVDLLSLTAWQMLLGSLPLILVGALTWTGSPVWSGSLVIALLYNIFLGNAVAWLLWLYILHSLTAGTAGLGTLLTPVIGVVAAWIQLGERPGWTEGVGMAAIVGALLIVTAWGLVVGRRRQGGRMDGGGLRRR